MKTTTIAQHSVSRSRKLYSPRKLKHMVNQVSSLRNLPCLFLIFNF
jgi:hypothetical protein